MRHVRGDERVQLMSPLSPLSEKMNATEHLIYEYLRYNGYTEIAFEPDGKVPPDFLVDGRIAVEARRLNQYYMASSRPHGLEEDARPLRDSIEKLAHSLGPPTRDCSWFVSHDFRRPVKSWKKLAPRIREALRAFMISPSEERTKIRIDNRFLPELFPASYPHSTFYVMGGQMDWDSGG